MIRNNSRHSLLCHLVEVESTFPPPWCWVAHGTGCDQCNVSRSNRVPITAKASRSMAWFCLPSCFPVVYWEKNMAQVASCPRSTVHKPQLGAKSSWAHPRSSKTQAELKQTHRSMGKKGMLVILRHWILEWFIISHYCRKKLMNTLHNSFFHSTIIHWVTSRYQILVVGFRDAMGSKTKWQK